MKTFMTLLALLCVSQATLQAQEAIWGKTLVTSGCASGGMDYYFFRDFAFIGRCSGCESSPYVVYGLWEQEGKDIILTTQKVYEGQPEGDPIPPCGSVCNYESYKATVYDKEEVETITSFGDEFDCSELKEGAPNWLETTQFSVHGALQWADAQRDYPELSTREWQKSELQNKSKSELRLMRNEIFAAYGYKFKSEELTEHFRKRGMYGYMSDVNAFLSDKEKQNIELIRQVERSK